MTIKQFVLSTDQNTIECPLDGQKFILEFIQDYSDDCCAKCYLAYLNNLKNCDDIPCNYDKRKDKNDGYFACKAVADNVNFLTLFKDFDIEIIHETFIIKNNE